MRSTTHTTRPALRRDLVPRRLAPLGLALCAALVAVPVAMAAPGDTVRLSLDAGGAESNGDSGRSVASTDGRFVAFTSVADDLVFADVGGNQDIFVRDRQTGTTTRASVSFAGIEGNQGSHNPSISGDGRIVAFETDSTNMVIGDTNARRDVFVRDLVAGTTTRASVGAGVQGDDDSDSPSVSRDGRYVAFESRATNLVPGDGNGDYDVFVRDLVAGTTTRVSVSSGGVEGDRDSRNAAISADGRYVAFNSGATNLVPGDTDMDWDVYVHDRATGETERISVTSGGADANGDHFDPQISDDGRHVAFWSNAEDLVPGDTNGQHDIFRHDRVTGETVRVNVSATGAQDDGGAEQPTISGDGRRVGFYSYATTLLPGDANGLEDVYVKDVESGEVIRASRSSAGAGADDSSVDPTLTGDGLGVVFTSAATNLVIGDGNAHRDVFSHELPAPPDPPAPPADPPAAPTGGGTSGGGAPASSQDAVAAAPACRAVTPKPVRRFKTRLDERTLIEIQRNAQDAIRRVAAINRRLRSGLATRDLCGGSFTAADLAPGIALTTGAATASTPAAPARLAIGRRPRGFRPSGRRLTSLQLLINQRVAQAAIRRLNALDARLNGGLGGGDLADGALTPAKLAPGLAVAGAGGPEPAPVAPPAVVKKTGKGGRVTLTLAQVRINERISAAALRRANRLVAKMEGGLGGADFRDGSIGPRAIG